jgi:hypothetical protein
MILPFTSFYYGYSSFKNKRLLSVPLGLTFQNSAISAHTVILHAKYGWIFITLVKKHPLLQIAPYRHVHRIQPYRLLGPRWGAGHPASTTSTILNPRLSSLNY